MVDMHSVEVEAGDLLWGIVRHERPKVIVETGTAFGYSAFRMAQACDENGVGEIYTIDCSKWEPRFNHDRVHRLFGNSQERIDGVPEVIDLLFLDAEHSCRALIRESDWLYPRLRPGGIVICHDWYIREIRDFALHAKQNLDALPAVFHGGRGMFVWAKP